MPRSLIFCISVVVSLSSSSFFFEQQFLLLLLFFACCYFFLHRCPCLLLKELSEFSYVSSLNVPFYIFFLYSSHSLLHTSHFIALVIVTDFCLVGRNRNFYFVRKSWSSSDFSAAIQIWSTFRSSYFKIFVNSKWPLFKKNVISKCAMNLRTTKQTCLLYHFQLHCPGITHLIPSPALT